jgi:uncharacterized DUF497 family protein
MRFEFDPAKSARNKAKHGIDFIEAQALWNDDVRVETPSITLLERRSIVTGRIQQTLWSAVITYRHENTTIRLISVRHPHPVEIARYRDRRRDD